MENNERAGQPRTQESGSAPLLTIAIPTYNRSRFLQELLSSIADDVAQEDSIEVLISDNASTDDTASVVEEFSRLRTVASIRNVENIGPDANFVQCLQRASGKYVWIIGDDDVIAPNGVRVLASLLSRADYDLVYITSYPLSSSGGDAGQIQAIEFTDAAAFAKRVNIYFSFISGNIINRQRFSEEQLQSFSGFVGTNLIQLSWVFAALNQFRLGLFIPTKLIGARVDNTGGYRLGEVFATKLKRIVDTQINSPRLRKVILSGTVQRYWPGLLIDSRRQKGFHEDPNLRRTLRQAFGCIPKYWFFVYPILLLPDWLGSVWFFGLRVLNRIDRAMGYVL